MKKIILSWGLIAMAFGLTNCVQENDFGTNSNKAQEYALYTDILESRTTNSGVNTFWADDDNLNVFHAISNSDEYVNDGEFKIQDATTGYFKGELGSVLSEDQSYDWYAFYPYSSTHTKPGEGRSYIIGNTNATAKQTQIGNNNMSHIAGKNFPLMGIAKGVATNEVPTLAMQNVASMAKFIVKNALSEAITINSISFNAPGQHLTGYFFVDFTDIENVTYKPDSSKTSDTANLAISNGEAIAAGAQAEFYLAIAPFSKVAGEEVSFTITATNKDGVEGTCIKSTTAALTFTQGLQKNITINYNAPFENLPLVSTESEPYIVGFESDESFIASTTYKVADIRYTGPENRQWGTVYGTPSTTGKISGAQSMHMRIYNVNGVWSDSYTYTNFTLSHVKEVRFEATSENNNNIKLSYRTAGKNWVDLKTYTLSSTAKAYKYEFESVVESAQFKFTIVNDNPTDGKRVIIDNVTFSANEILASANATTKEATNTESADGTTATLNGAYDIINGSGEEAITCGFEYKSADNYTSVTAENATEFTYNLTGLTVDTEYTYRAWVSLDGGATKVYGESASFTTTKASTILKSISLTTTDIKNIGIKYGYTDSDIKSISASDGSVWTAYHAYRTASSSTIGVKKETPDGYLATPVVSGTITKIVINIKSTGANTKFTLAHRDNDVFYTSDKLGITTKDWSVDITNDCSQIFIHSAYGTVTINSVTIYYE